MSDEELSSKANGIGRQSLANLWRQYGLPDRSSDVTFDARVECLERWVDILYGRGIAVTSRIKQRAESARDRGSQAAAQFSAGGGHLSIIDPIDSLVEAISAELPEIEGPRAVETKPPSASTGEDRQAFRVEFLTTAAQIESGPESLQAAVGHAINLANSLFRKQHSTPEAFIRRPRTEQNEYITILTRMELKLRNERKDDAASIGVGLFKMWVGTLVANDTELQREFEGPLSRLSRKGDLSE